MSLTTKQIHLKVKNVIYAQWPATGISTVRTSPDLRYVWHTESIFARKENSTKAQHMIKVQSKRN
jgi:hypothetical protein